MSEQNQFTHLDQSGKVKMVNVGSKQATQRYAKARAIVQVSDEILAQFQDQDIQTKKGPVFQTAIIAGIMGAKKTGELIPLCHPLGLDNCNVSIQINEQNQIEIVCEASLFAKTGVEMEAMTGASIAALTIYDMCKAFSHDITIGSIQLIEKTGGKRDFRRDFVSEV